MTVINPALVYLSPHESFMGAAVTGTVDDTYEATDLCDGDPHFEISRTGNLSLTAAGSSLTGINGAVIANHNLVATTVVTFGGGIGAHTATAPVVPPDGIRENFSVLWTPAVTASGFTIAITSHPTRIVIGEVFVGQFREMRAMPSGSNLGFRAINVAAGGEYGGIDTDRGAAPPRVYGGTVYLNDAAFADLKAFYLATRNGSRPGVIIPFPSRDPLVVKFTTFNPQPVAVDIQEDAAWQVNVEWEELARFRVPVEA